MPTPDPSSRSLYDIFAVINYEVAPKLIGVIGCRHTGGGRAGAGGRNGDSIGEARGSWVRAVKRWQSQSRQQIVFSLRYGELLLSTQQCAARPPLLLLGTQASYLRLLQTAEIEPRKAVTSNNHYLRPLALRRKRKLDAIAVSVTLLRAAIMMMGDTGRRKF